MSLALCLMMKNEEEFLDNFFETALLMLFMYLIRDQLINQFKLRKNIQLIFIVSLLIMTFQL